MNKFTPDLNYSDTTPRHVWLNRRQIMMGGAGLAIAGVGVKSAYARSELNYQKGSIYSTDQELTEYVHVTSYNNFYEFGTDKTDPQKRAHNLTTEPWIVEVDGLCNNPGKYNVNDLIERFTLEERIYRLRCVEAWSMVIPWIGFQLSELVKHSDPQSNAKYIAFETALRPSEMVGVRYGILDWPYREGLRLDEAMNPLSIISVGLYGEVLPKQNGAPIRLVVPWKYGFKSIKSIVRVTFTESEPHTSWNVQNSREYGFYSNVNPDVSHPRWSQAKERVIGGGLFVPRIPTQIYNGYGEYVAHLYKGMDLNKYY